MNVPTEFVAGAGLLLIGGTATWVRSVENRLSNVDTLVGKLDRLVDVLLENQLGKADPEPTHNGPHTRRGASGPTLP